MSIVTKNLRVKNRLPTWVYFAIFAVAMLMVVLYFTFPPWATIINGFGVAIIDIIIGFATWLATMQFFVGVGITVLVAVVIVGRKYIWGQKVTVAQPTTTTLPPDQLSQGGVFNNNPLQQSNNLIVEEEK